MATPGGATIITETKLVFEKRLYGELEDMDDPLELFIEYISWLHEVQQHTQNTRDLESVIERCLLYFKDIETYKNDPRYLKIWLLYMDFFHHTDLAQCNIIYTYLFHLEIGNKLTMFYEEFSNVLFELTHYIDAYTILQIGLKYNSRPYNRLLRSISTLNTNLKQVNITIPNKTATDFLNFKIEPNFIKKQDQQTDSKIYNDNSNEPVYKIINISGRKPEKIDCNFNLIYNTQEEFNFEQILAQARGCYHKIKKQIYNDNDNTTGSLNIDSQDHMDKKPKLKPLVEKIILSSSQPYTSTQISDNKNIITKTSILPLKDDEDDSTHTKKHAPNSPTVTMFSKDAMSDVYSMFNQNYNDEQINETDDTTTSKFAIYDNFTQDFTRQNIDDLTEVKPVVSTVPTVPIIEENNTQYNNNVSTLPEFMTPIQERTENSFHNLKDTDPLEHNNPNIKSTQSSPFLTQPQLDSKPRNVIIEHPLDSTLRNNLLSTIQPPLDQYTTFYRYNQSLKMSALLKRIHKISLSENKNPIVDFKKTGDLYCIRAELGQGGYATVYLAESSTGNLKALKIEKPASVWEYYILKQIEQRLLGSDILKSIIQVSSLHYFLDESYLVLNYCNQGTVLDLVNSMEGNSMDEILCMFITVELMKVIEKIHKIGIIHGDLKPDNCMIRLEPTSTLEELGTYNSEGLDSWQTKGIFLIDFGRSFDLTLFPPGAQFKADWKTDQQDCSEMRLGKPWTFEADYYGLAGIIHSMLFGKFIETIRLANNQYKLRNTFKRYWQSDIWNVVFDTLLNSGDQKFGTLPIIPKIQVIRKQIESFLKLESNSDKLRKLILDLEVEFNLKNKKNLVDDKKRNK